MKKRFGFTLAEVLITLGIIGVVAAMTIPTLIQNTSSTKFSAQFKKTLATLNNAAEMAQAHYDASFSTITQTCTNPATDTMELGAATNRNSICGLVNATMTNVRSLGTVAQAYPNAQTRPGAAGLAALSEAAGGTGTDGNVRMYALADGAFIAVPNAMTNANQAQTCRRVAGADPATLPAANCHGFIDVNGAAGPNQATRCNGNTVVANASNGGCANLQPSDIRDIFPIVFYDGVVSPSSTAAREVLARGK